LTKPIVEQIQRHLVASGGAFAADDLVTIEAAGNDLDQNVVALLAAVAAGGNATAAGQTAINAMGRAGGELAAYIKALIVGKGAKQVVVLSHPDISRTPDSVPFDQATRDLLEMMSFTFNAFLTEGLKGVPEVLVVDSYGLIRDLAANPSRYGVDDSTTLACPVFPAAGRPLALFCSSTALAPGIDPNRVAWADSSHPTPKGHQIIADAALAAMRTRGWAP
jgi:phospholipase/lecithinase/hemolysin